MKLFLSFLVAIFTVISLNAQLQTLNEYSRNYYDSKRKRIVYDRDSISIDMNSSIYFGEKLVYKPVEQNKILIEIFNGVMLVSIFQKDTIRDEKAIGLEFQPKKFVYFFDLKTPESIFYADLENCIGIQIVEVDLRNKLVCIKEGNRIKRIVLKRESEAN